jgi:hypothetical protein
MTGTVIDIKTGKAQKWVALQLAAYSLLNSTEVDFDEESHVYTYRGQKLDSVTKILLKEGFIDTHWLDEWSRDRGSYVHKAIDYYLDDCLDEESLAEEIIPYLSAFKKFMAESGFVVKQHEVPMVNTTYLYSGKADLIGCFPKPTSCRRFALELTNDEKYKLIPYTDQADFNVWLSIVACHRWKKNNLKFAA